MKTTTMKMVISFASLAFFIVISTACFIYELFVPESGYDNGLRYSTDLNYLGNNIYRETHHTHEFKDLVHRSIITGKKDKDFLWDGPYRRESYNRSQLANNDPQFEEGMMVKGQRHGKWNYINKDGVVHVCYDMGETVPCGDKSAISENDINAFDVLTEQYYWYLYSLNGYELTDEQIKSFIERIEAGLAEYEFEMEDFDTYYDWALDEIEEDPGDDETVFNINSLRTMAEGVEQLQFFPLRFAVIEHFRSLGNPTYNIIKGDHPGFIDQVVSYEEVEATEQDFALFCADLDARMAIPGPLDREDPFFVDSVNVRMFRAFYDIMKEIQSSASPGKLLKAASPAVMPPIPEKQEGLS